MSEPFSITLEPGEEVLLNLRAEGNLKDLEPLNWLERIKKKLGMKYKTGIPITMVDISK